MNHTRTRIVPLVKRPGGKSRMLKTLLPLIDSSPHRCYVEPFCGGAAVLLAKQPSEHEVINDLDGDLVCLYRQVKYHPDALIQEMQWLIESRRDFIDYGAQVGLTEIQRAARWLYRNFYSFSGDNSSFGVKRLGFNTRSWLLAKVTLLHARLDRVTVEQLSWDRCVALYDSPDTLIYLDPPYTSGDVRSYAPWTDADVHRLAEVLAGVRGRWILTLNDSPSNRAAFPGCRIQAVSTAAAMRAARRPGSRFGEIIVSPPSEKSRRR